MAWCSIEPRTRKYVKGYGFFTFASKYRKQLMDAGLDALETVSKKVVEKAAEATGEFVWNKIADKIVKIKHVIDENSRNIAEIIVPPEKREEILSESRQLLSKWNSIKYQSY